MDIERSLVIELRDSLYQRAADLRKRALLLPNQNGQEAASMRGRATGAHHASQMLDSLLAGNHAWRHH